ncbi:MAG: Tol biopolymer transport system periplasmic component [Bacteroidetes bacterium]|nr:Tol biopolymer transport system periplasmic component [Bacteroidota bacterium]
MTRPSRHLLQLASLIATILLAVPGTAPAQEDFFHPELNWHVIETDHFKVTYHDGAERTARVVAVIAEEIYEPVTSLYQHEPDEKVSFVIKDYDDISNGAAYFYDNKIEIYAPSMDFELRGTHNWLRNVITHEFTHIVQIQTSMKFGRTMPAFYFQWLNYESERRPDVLYGYPNVIVSYPYSGFVVPAWFAEGVAQYNRQELRYDFWDSHRDMILRSYALDGNMLGWEEMGVFGKTSLGNESSYNAGFAFVSYIASTYGEEKLVDISRALAGFGTMTIDGAIEKVLEKPGKAVYDEWRLTVEREYASRVQPIREHVQRGEPLIADTEGVVVNPSQIQGSEGFHHPSTMHPGRQMLSCCRLAASTGFANLYAEYSPDGGKVAYVSAKGGDYFSLSALWVFDVATKEDKLVKGNVRTRPAWSPDGKRLYYARLTRDNPHWSLVYDLYAYDLVEEEEERLTRGARALTPAVSPDGKTLVFVVSADGTTNLAAMPSTGGEIRRITSFSSGEQVYNPRWSPSGDRIVFDYSIKDGRDLATIRPDGTELTFHLSGPEDTRGATFTPDGTRILYSSDQTGIFNVYERTLADGSTRQLTNVLGGAFYPSVNAAGDIVYSLYTSGGYKLYRLPAPAPVPQDGPRYLQPAVKLPPGPAPVLASADGTPQFDWADLRTYDDTKTPEMPSKPYRSNFLDLNVVPFLRVDNYNAKATGLELIKLGAYVFSNELLDKTGFFAGAALNVLLERDLFMQFFYRGQLPGFYQLGLEPVASIELYNVTRKTDNYISLPASTIPVDVTYNLLEFDAVLNQRALSQFSNVELRYAHSRYTSIIDNFINPETQELTTGSSDLYLIANTLTMSFSLDNILPSRTDAINPVGRRILLRVGQEWNMFNGDGEYEVTSTGLQPVYKDVDFQRIELQWREHLPFFFPSHTLTANFRAGTIVGPAVDEFFDFYASGLLGMKGYPFYAMGGNEMLAFGLAYRFPLINSIDLRIAALYFDKLYLSLYGDIGNAWTDSSPALKDYKTDIGAQLRLESFSFYSYPTRIFFDAAYGFSKFDRFVPSQNKSVTYGQEWRFYFGILFGFDFD